MLRDARFWRSVTISAVAHIAIIGTLVGWKHETRKSNLQSIVWMSGGDAEAAAQSTPLETETAKEKTPPPETLRSKPENDELSAPTPGRSDLELPIATPSPVPVTTPPPKPSMTSAPNPAAKPAPKLTPKVPRKKPVVAKVTPKPSLKTKAIPAEQEKKKDENVKETTKIPPRTNANGATGEEADSNAPGGSAIRASEFSWYGKMLHGRFYREWIQPTTSLAVGAKISALVRIRIEQDGRITNFTIVKPSGNVVVDESVAAIAKKVTQVDPLPKGLGGAFYEVNINFELNPEQ